MTDVKHLVLLLTLLITFNSFADELSDAFDAYERGDYSTAFDLYEKLANQGNAKAQFNLGYMYDIGQGLPQDYKQAVHWYTKAAEQGYAKAQHNLGILYGNSRGVLQDYVKAHMY